jgi:putative CocE/NonD family hydrolase
MAMSGALIEYNVPVPMRDGVVLRADVYRPAGPGRWPVVVTRTPYDKSDPTETGYLDPLLAVKRGLIAVIQDVRGRYASEGGEWSPFVNEAEDGADTVAWAAGLPGSSGHVGMWGGSYMGNVQWQAAALRPSRLGAIAPSITFRTVDDGFRSRGGARELGLTRAWGLGTGFEQIMRRHPDPTEQRAALSDLVDAFDGMPGATFDELPTGSDPFIERHGLPAPDIGAGAADVNRWQPDVEVPVLNVGGWFDIFLQGTLDNHAASERESRLIVGPWNHIGFTPQQGDVNFGLASSGAAVDLGDSLNGLTFEWLRSSLMGEESGGEDPVRIFVMGANTWRSEKEWPPTRAVETKFYLTPDAGASVNPTVSSGETVQFVYAPADPVPTFGGATYLPHVPAGSFDQVLIEQRDDVLVFTSDPLDEDLEVTGRVTASLHVSTDAPSTDWVVRLCDVHPDGRSFNVVDGIARVDHVPFEPSRVEVDLWSTSMLFRAGHRLRFHVTSSCFPRWDRNLNTADGFESGEMAVAHQTVHLGEEAYISLPVLPR